MAVILITGCSSGFGMLMAARLASSGHTVYATMRDLSKKEDLLKEVERRNSQVRLLQLDVTDDDSILSAKQHVIDEEGRLDVLVNNAGYGIAGFFEDLTEDEIRRQMETNFFGVQKVIRHFLPLMREGVAQSPRNGCVKIINISSAQGRSAMPGLSAYGASKFALEGFSESLYFELNPFRIKVVLVEPGAFTTKAIDHNSKRAARTGDPESPYTPFAELFEKKYQSALASGRGIGDPEYVARLVERIIKRPNPRFRYVIGGQAKLRLLLRAILPFTWFAVLVNRLLFGKTGPAKT